MNSFENSHLLSNFSHGYRHIEAAWTSQDSVIKRCGWVALGVVELVPLFGLIPTLAEKAIKSWSIDQLLRERELAVLEEIESDGFHLQELYFDTFNSNTPPINHPPERDYLENSLIDLQLFSLIKHLKKEAEQEMSAQERSLLEQCISKLENMKKPALLISALIFSHSSREKTKLVACLTDCLNGQLQQLAEGEQMIMPFGYIGDSPYGWPSGERNFGHAALLNVQRSGEYFFITVYNTGDDHSAHIRDSDNKEHIYPLSFQCPLPACNALCKEIVASSHAADRKNPMGSMYDALEKFCGRPLEIPKECKSYQTQKINNCPKKSLQVWLHQQCAAAEMDYLYKKFRIDKLQTILQNVKKIVPSSTLQRFQNRYTFLYTHPAGRPGITGIPKTVVDLAICALSLVQSRFRLPTSSATIHETVAHGERILEKRTGKHAVLELIRRGDINHGIAVICKITDHSLRESLLQTYVDKALDDPLFLEQFLQAMRTDRDSLCGTMLDESEFTDDEFMQCAKAMAGIDDWRISMQKEFNQQHGEERAKIKEAKFLPLIDYLNAEGRTSEGIEFAKNALSIVYADKTISQLVVLWFYKEKIEELLALARDPSYNKQVVEIKTLKDKNFSVAINPIKGPLSSLKDIFELQLQRITLKKAFLEQLEAKNIGEVIQIVRNLDTFESTNYAFHAWMLETIADRSLENADLLEKLGQAVQMDPDSLFMKMVELTPFSSEADFFTLAENIVSRTPWQPLFDKQKSIEFTKNCINALQQKGGVSHLIKLWFSQGRIAELIALTEELSYKNDPIEIPMLIDIDGTRYSGRNIKFLNSFEFREILERQERKLALKREILEQVRLGNIINSLQRLNTIERALFESTDDNMIPALLNQIAGTCAQDESMLNEFTQRFCEAIGPTSLHNGPFRKLSAAITFTTPEELRQFAIDIGIQSCIPAIDYLIAQGKFEQSADFTKNLTDAFYTDVGSLRAIELLYSQGRFAELAALSKDPALKDLNLQGLRPLQYQNNPPISFLFVNCFGDLSGRFLAKVKT